MNRPNWSERRTTVVAGGLVLVVALLVGSPHGASSVTGSETVHVSRDVAAHQVVLVSQASGRDDVRNSYIYGDTLPEVRFATFDRGDQNIEDTYVYGIAPRGAVSVDVRLGVPTKQ